MFAKKRARPGALLVLRICIHAWRLRVSPAEAHWLISAPSQPANRWLYIPEPLPSGWDRAKRNSNFRVCFSSVREITKPSVGRGTRRDRDFRGSAVDGLQVLALLRVHAAQRLSWRRCARNAAERRKMTPGMAVGILGNGRWKDAGLGPGFDNWLGRRTGKARSLLLRAARRLREERIGE